LASLCVYFYKESTSGSDTRSTPIRRRQNRFSKPIVSELQ